MRLSGLIGLIGHSAQCSVGMGLNQETERASLVKTTSLVLVIILEL